MHMKLDRWFHRANWLWALVFLLLTGRSLAATIEVVAINTGNQKTVASALFRAYQDKNPGVQINLTSLSDSEFKEQLPKWLASSSTKYHLVFWQGGNRLFRFVNQGQVAPISKAIPEGEIAAAFTPGSLGAVTLDDQIYAVPTSYYQWGIYYRKSIFRNAGLTPPSNWQEFIEVGQALSRQGITPIALGNSGKWPASAWFDYLNLRINGLEFHKALLQGEHSFNDPKVTQVFAHWKELVDNGFFIKHQDVVDWNDALPFIYHSHAAMVLIGNFVTGELSPAMIDDFAFIPFPTISSQVPSFEDAPLDVVMIPSNASVSKELKDFVKYLSSASFQSEYNRELGLISPHVDATLPNNEFIQSGARLLAEAEGVAQFFDRDTKAAFVGPALDVFAEFLKTGDANAAQNRLEQLRQQHLSSTL